MNDEITFIQKDFVNNICDKYFTKILKTEHEKRN